MDQGASSVSENPHYIQPDILSEIVGDRVERDIVSKAQRKRYEKQLDRTPQTDWFLRRLNRAFDHRSLRTIQTIKHNKNYQQHRAVREAKCRKRDIYRKRARDDAHSSKRTFMDD